MRYYYTDAQNRPTGPVELDQLRQLHAQGTLSPQSSVIPEGASQWTTLGAILVAAPAPNPAPTPSPAAAAPGRPALSFIDTLGTSLGGIVEVFLELLRKGLTESFLTRTLGGLTRCGHLLVLAGAGLGLIYTIVQAIRANSFQVFGGGLVLILWIALLQYVALRFFTANQALVANSPSRVGSAALLDCLALILAVGAVVALVGGTVDAIRSNEFGSFVGGLLSSIVLLLGAGAALNPQLSNVRLAESSAGEEAIGLASFFGKASLVMLPLVFAALSLTGVIVIVVSFFATDSNSGAASFVQTVLGFVPALGRFGSADAGLAGVGLLLQACLLPLIAYLGFLVLYLSLDLMRAVLEVPRKLDHLSR